VCGYLDFSVKRQRPFFSLLVAAGAPFFMVRHSVLCLALNLSRALFSRQSSLRKRRAG
jgi:hypothetical protein